MNAARAVCPRNFNPWSVLVSAILREGMICSFLGHKSFHASSASCKVDIRIKISLCKKTAFSDGSISKNIKINLSQEYVYCIRLYTHLWILIIHVSVFQRLPLTILSTMGDVMSSVADLLNKSAVHFGRAEMDLLSSFIHL